MREALQQLSQTLEAQASEKTAELIAGISRVEMRQDAQDESQDPRKYLGSSDREIRREDSIV
jgi:hypothetical protein